MNLILNMSYQFMSWSDSLELDSSNHLLHSVRNAALKLMDLTCDGDAY